MSTVTNFKCPCCGANIPFSGATGEMTCKACDASFSVEELQKANEAMAEASQGSSMQWSVSEQSFLTDENGKVRGYRCPTCGAEMTADENTAVTECPYCGNSAIIEQQFEGVYKPELVVPFAIEKPAASAMIRDFIKDKKLIPNAFLQGNRIQDIQGMYVPFWLYSCHAEGSVNFEGVDVDRKETETEIIETKKYYNVIRSGEMDFEKIPVDASTRMDDATMDSLEPYDLSKAVPYNAAYFSGFLADRYDVSEKDAQPRANERVKNTFRQKMREKVTEYDQVTEKGESIHLSNGKAQYAMLPVYMMTTKYEGKTYTFGINGQSGEMVGSLPVDKGKYFMRLGIAALITLVICAAALYFLGGGLSGAGIIGSLVVGIIVGLVYAGILKGNMNTIAKKQYATKYINDKSIKYRPNQDHFLYKKTERREKPKQNS